MNIPIFDITNIPEIPYKIVNNTKLNEWYALSNLERLLEFTGEYLPHNDYILFISCNMDYDTINKYYKEFYGTNYVYKKYNNLIYLVMQKDIPIQIFIPEKICTFIYEYKNIMLTYDIIKTFYYKVSYF